jgi:hypothetical protein
MSGPAARDEFKNYLVQTGLADSIERVISSLYDEYDERTNPLDYVKQYLGAPKGVVAADLVKANDQLKREITELESRAQALRSRA